MKPRNANNSSMNCNLHHAMGFTLIELIMVIVILSIVSVVIAPKFADKSIFQARGFADQVLAALRFAQKTAIAQHRLVCVGLSSPTISLKIATVSGATDCSLFSVLNLPDRAGNTLTAPTGITFTSPTSVNFDALGRTSSTATLTVLGVTPSITVEAETGYVHQ